MGILLAEPLGYLDFMALVAGSRIVLTDSGGLQEETTWHRIPCVTLRTSTERPITLTQGSNVLAGVEPARICELAEAMLEQPPGRHPTPALWDGQTAPRIVAILENWWAQRSARQATR
jgi:UDP-N-acetylglucosamine 2-epimerase (non-hydrolysing)